MVREREYTIFATDKEQAKRILQTANFEIDIFDEEKYISNTISDIKNAERID